MARHLRFALLGFGGLAGDVVRGPAAWWGGQQAPVAPPAPRAPARLREYDVVAALDAAGISRLDYRVRAPAAGGGSILVEQITTPDVMLAIARALGEAGFHGRAQRASQSIIVDATGDVAASAAAETAAIMARRAAPRPSSPAPSCPLPASPAAVPGPPPAGWPIGVGETREIHGMRVHLFRGSLRVTDLANAGKRGKTCGELTVSWWEGNDEADRYARELVRRIVAAPTYSAALAVARAGATRDLPGGGVQVDERPLKGVHVAPGGFEEINVRGPHVAVSAGRFEFSISDLDDRNNEPRCISGSRAGQREVARFYTWAKANRAKIPSMTMDDVMEAMEKIGVRCHYFCGVD